MGNLAFFNKGSGEVYKGVVELHTIEMGWQLEQKTEYKLM